MRILSLNSLNLSLNDYTYLSLKKLSELKDEIVRLFHISELTAITKQLDTLDLLR